MQCVVGVKTEEVLGKTEKWRVKEGFPEIKDLNNTDLHVNTLGKVIHNDLQLRGR